MKKLILTILIAFFTKSYSQTDCLTIKNDDIAEKSIAYTNAIILNNAKLRIIAPLYDSGVLYWIFKTDSNECFEGYNKVYIVCNNGTKIVTSNWLFGLNTGGKTGVILKKSEIKKLISNEGVKTIRLDTCSESKYIQLEISKEQSDDIIKNINCSMDFESYKKQIKYGRNVMLSYMNLND